MVRFEDEYFHHIFSVFSKQPFWICFPNDSAGLRFAVWMKGPSAGRMSVVGHDGYLATGHDALLSRHAGLRREQRERMTSLLRLKKKTDGGWVM